MRIQNIAKGFLKWVVIPYAVSYVAATGYAAVDYNFFNPNRIEQNQPQGLQVRRYTARINGEEKYLTLVGETHIYNLAEFKLGRKLVNEHTSFAGEVGSDDELPSGDALFNRINAELWRIPFKFYQYGSGRRYGGIDLITEKKGNKIHGLEKNPYESLSLREKASILVWSVSGFLTAPVDYYVGRFEDPSDYTAGCSGLIGEESLITKRDPVMAESIVRLLERADVNDLLVTMGSCHLDGVIEKLEKDIDLQQVIPKQKTGVDRQTKNVWIQQEIRYSRDLESRMRAKARI